MVALEFDTLVALCGSATVADVVCPLCVGQHTSKAGQKRECLRIWHEKVDFANYLCARCGAEGHAWADDKTPTTRRYRPAPPSPPPQPPPKPDRCPTARFLWGRATPIAGTPAETYLRARGCWLPTLTDNLKFLSANPPHPPAMIARFGENNLTGVHLTKLHPNGCGKAGTDADKLILGECMGQPIMVHCNEDHEELIIAEGIEDALSLALVTGWTAWAAGTANRIAPVVAHAVQSGFHNLYLAVDDDPVNTTTYQANASQRALTQAKIIAPWLIPVNFTRALAVQNERYDANKMLQRHGPEKTMAVIELCAAQTAFHAGNLYFHSWRAAQRKFQLLFTERCDMILA